MHKKDVSRIRRSGRTRARIRRQGAYRLSVHRTPQHIYAQIIAPDGAKTLVSAASVEKALREGLEHTGNVEAARKVGSALAERAKSAGVTQVAFDRAGFKYHGRVKALADAAREGGLEF